MGHFFVDLVAFLNSSRRALSGGLNLSRLQRRAPTVSGRRPRASRVGRGGSAAPTRGYLGYWLFLATARRFARPRARTIKRTAQKGARCTRRVRRGSPGCSTGDCWWLDGCTACSLAYLAPPESELRRRFYLSGGPLGAGPGPKRLAEDGSLHRARSQQPALPVESNPIRP